MDTKTCEITWTIENFPLLLGPESVHMDALESTKFDSNTDKKLTDELSFSLRLVPCFVDKQNESKHVSLYLQVHTDKKFEKQVVWYRFAVYGFNGKELLVKGKNNCTFKANHLKHFCPFFRKWSKVWPSSPLSGFSTIHFSFKTVWAKQLFYNQQMFHHKLPTQLSVWHGIAI